MVMNSKFAGVCKACGIYFPAGTVVEWTKGVGARHATIHGCHAAKMATAAAKPVPPPAAKLDLTPIVKFLQDAKDRGLKFPKLRVLHTDNRSELRISLTVKGAAPGSVCVILNGEFLGCIRPDMSVSNRIDQALQEHLLLVAKDPVAAAKAYAAVMCQCSFCGLPLTDAGSVEVGYGPVCAKHWGLPHNPKGTPTLSPVPQGAGSIVVPFQGRLLAQ